MINRIQRATIWAVSMALISYFLGVEWTWHSAGLCVLSTVVHDIVYADYSAVDRARQKRTEG